ncbi:uncharacterized protein N7525_005632 [Penicillium rubens]|jgi:hypothetical protein|uniref:uncharacterized protein n=1 Tax=Penicillium rubens TaxID=1108849 RepID=UPI002A5A4A12|nr:uncharacterized protein N7525_005632 [Penicillium rubens]KAJ5840444.1 hypothetical protein N7525_005632 [Penicillium rubens]
MDGYGLPITCSGADWILIGCWSGAEVGPDFGSAPALRANQHVYCAAPWQFHSGPDQADETLSCRH